MAQTQSGTVVVEGGSTRYANLTAGTALVKTGAGNLDGIVINSHSSGVIKIQDGITFAGSVMHNSISFAAGERFIPFRGEIFGTGLIVTIGGTADVTIQYR